MALTAQQILYRITSAEQEGLWQWKQKIYQIRGICAGAKEFLSNASPGNSQDFGQRLQRSDAELRPDIMVQRIMEGKSNDLLKLLGQLMQKVTLKNPDIFFEGVDPKEQIINSAYMNKRLGPLIYDGCEAYPQTCMAVMDYLMGGLGSLYLSVEEDGAPTWRWADTLDLVWDQTARLPNMVTWMAMAVSKPLWYWQEMFPDAAVLRTIMGNAKKLSDMVSDRNDDDQPITLMFYYDIEQDGHQAVFVKTGDNSYLKEEVYLGENPHRRTVGGTKKTKPFLPFSNTFYMALPSVRMPVALAERMLPAQIAIWKAITLITNIIDRGSPFYKAKDDAFVDAKAKEAFMRSGNPGAIAFVTEMDAIGMQEPLMIPPSVGEELQRNLREILEQVGTSNAASGQGTPGFGGHKMSATEFQAIQGASQLTPSSVQADVTRLLEDAYDRFLWNGKLFDDRPFSCLVNGVEYNFEKGKPDPVKKTLGPVGLYLRPDRKITIGEDSMTHIPRTQKIAEAQSNLQVAQGLAQLFPNAPALAYRKFLELQGEPNVDEYLRPAQPGQQQQPGMPGSG